MKKFPIRDTFFIRYLIDVPKQITETFDLTFDAETALLIHGAVGGDGGNNLPNWTALDYARCPNCPLSLSEHKHCPPAVNLIEVVKGFERIYSYEKAAVTVTTKTRTITAETTVEIVLRSLMGLVMATSGCPQLAFFRPMARFHLPFADGDETLFRATATYLLTQYVAHMRGQKPRYDLKGLADIYAEVQVVNIAFAERLRQAAKADGTMNGLVSLDLLAQTMPMALDGMLEEITHLFDPYLETQK